MAFLSTTTRVLALLLLLVVAVPGAPSRAADPQDFVFVYLYQDYDPAYAEQRAYTGLKLRERKRPLAGAETAFDQRRSSADGQTTIL